MRIPFYKPSVGTDEINEVVDTLRSGWLTTGPKTRQFEQDFAAYLRQKHAVAVNSCTAALHLALEAIGLKAGQGVVLPTMTFAATAEVVRYFGARPLLADCRVVDLNLDTADAERKIQSALAQGLQVAGIIPMHYGGQIGDVAGVQSLARRYHLKIIEDAAHACPAFYRDGLTGGNGGTGPNPLSAAICPAGDGGWLPVGSAANISCYSFYANKTLTTGEGGMACTNNDEYADRMRVMSLHGISRDAWKRYTTQGSWYYEIVAPGFKYNLTDIASAIGLHQVRKADALHRRRTELAQYYTQRLGDIEEIILPQAQPDRVHSWHLYPIRLVLERLRIDRGQFIAELQARAIGTSVHWMPLHMHPFYRETYGYSPHDLPVAAGLYPQLITLPLYPGMTQEEADYVCDSVKEVVCRQKSSGQRAPSATHGTAL